MNNNNLIKLHRQDIYNLIEFLRDIRYEPDPQRCLLWIKDLKDKLEN